MARGIIVGSKVVSVRKCPWDPLSDETVKDIKKHEPVMVDTNKTIYDWKGYEYYPFIDGGHQNGYIRKDAVHLNQTVSLTRRPKK